MTSLLKREAVEHTALWRVMPGWGVVADLTPPELVEMRRLRVLRKMMVAALIAVVVACAAGYAFAMAKESSAEDALAATQAQGVSLAGSTGKYAPVQRIQAATAGIDTRVKQLLTTDVDTARLLQDLRAALPSDMTVSSVSVAYTPTGGAAGATAMPTTPVAPTVDGTAPSIGTVTMAGSSRSLADLAMYVLALQRIRGVADVLPGSNTASAKGATWSLTLGLTKARFSHQFDTNGGRTGGTR